MILNKQKTLQALITAAITFIVAMVGLIIFNISVALYSGITAGLSLSAGGEYVDVVTNQNIWNWHDIVPGVIGVIIGVLSCVVLYYI